MLLVGGKGSSQYEAAEVLYYLDELLNIPVTVVEQSRLSSIDLAQYSHLLMVDGSYKSLSKATVESIKLWLKSGGVLFGQKRAASWLAEKEIVKAKFVSKEHIDELFDTDGLNYQDKERLAARKRIAGAIFESQLDLSHPLAYGYTDQQLPLFRNSTLIIDSYAQPFVTVANYSAKPLMSGYTDNHLETPILSVPVHLTKWQSRGYNQAHLIAKSFAQYTRLNYLPDVLIRDKSMPSQVGQSGKQRRKNINQAFSLANSKQKFPPQLILLDDVITTGTTVNAICKLLKNRGVEQVTVLTVAFTLPNNKQDN